MGRTSSVRMRKLVAVDRRSSVAQRLKRAVDVFGALIGLVLFSPLLLALAVLIKIDSRGSIIFYQNRIGKGGASFRMIKFRSMVPGAENDLVSYFKNSSGTRIKWAARQKMFLDPRLTRIGRHLRRYSLDELPQLWNVLKGEMSLVGPRPILPEQENLYGELFADYIQVRPGMTGLWQVSGRNLLSFTERAQLDARYLAGWSLGLDIQILLQTIWVVLRAKGAY